jgi:hypothetical protein
VPRGSWRFLVVALAERRPDTQKILSILVRDPETVAERLRFLARLEFGDDLPCLTVDYDECLQGAELSGVHVATRAEPMPPGQAEAWAASALTRRRSSTLLMRAP